MKKVYVVQLSSEEREQLQELIKRGNRKKGQRPSALKLTRARILLKADQADDAPAYTDAEIAEALDVSPKTVFNLRKRWVETGLEQALERRPQQNRRQPLRTRQITHRPAQPALRNLTLQVSSWGVRQIAGAGVVW